MEQVGMFCTDSHDNESQALIIHNGAVGGASLDHTSHLKSHEDKN
jgi:hypothetical protein